MEKELTVDVRLPKGAKIISVRRYSLRTTDECGESITISYVIKSDKEQPAIKYHEKELPQSPRMGHVAFLE